MRLNSAHRVSKSLRGSAVIRSWPFHLQALHLSPNDCVGKYNKMTEALSVWAKQDPPPWLVLAPPQTSVSRRRLGLPIWWCFPLCHFGDLVVIVNAARGCLVLAPSILRRTVTSCAAGVSAASGIWAHIFARQPIVIVPRAVTTLMAASIRLYPA